MITQADIEAFSGGEPRFVARPQECGKVLLAPVAIAEQTLKVWMALGGVALRLMTPIWLRPR